MNKKTIILGVIVGAVIFVFGSLIYSVYELKKDNAAMKSTLQIVIQASQQNASSINQIVDFINKNISQPQAGTKK